MRRSQALAIIRHDSSFDRRWSAAQDIYCTSSTRSFVVTLVRDLGALFSNSVSSFQRVSRAPRSFVGYLAASATRSNSEDSFSAGLDPLHFFAGSLIDPLPDLLSIPSCLEAFIVERPRIASLIVFQVRSSSSSKSKRSCESAAFEMVRPLETLIMLSTSYCTIDRGRNCSLFMDIRYILWVEGVPLGIIPVFFVGVLEAIVVGHSQVSV